MIQKNGLKICSKCKKEKPLSEYHKNKTQPDGYHNWCKKCLIEFRINYKEKKHKYDKQYHLDNRERKCEIASDWYYDNIDRAKEKCHEYYINHKDEHLERTREWRKTYPHESKLIGSRHKAKRRGMKSIRLFRNPFPKEIEVDLHHINDILVIPLPSRIHNLCSGKRDDHREKCKIWIYYLYGLDVDMVFNHK